MRSNAPKGRFGQFSYRTFQQFAEFKPPIWFFYGITSITATNWIKGILDYLHLRHIVSFFSVLLDTVLLTLLVVGIFWTKYNRRKNNS